MKWFAHGNSSHRPCAACDRCLRQAASFPAFAFTRFQLLPSLLSLLPDDCFFPPPPLLILCLRLMLVLCMLSMLSHFCSSCFYLFFPALDLLCGVRTTQTGRSSSFHYDSSWPQLLQDFVCSKASAPEFVPVLGDVPSVSTLAAGANWYQPWVCAEQEWTEQ